MNLKDIFSNKPNLKHVAQNLVVMNQLPVVYRPSKTIYLFFMAVACFFIFTKIGVPSSISLTDGIVIIGAIFSIWFGFYSMSEKGPKLIIDTDGFSYFQAFKTKKVYWHEVGNFTSSSFHNAKIIKWSRANSIVSREDSLWEKIFKSNTSFANIYDLDNNQLCILLNMLRIKYSGAGAINDNDFVLMSTYSEALLTLGQKPKPYKFGRP